MVELMVGIAILLQVVVVGKGATLPPLLPKNRT